MPSYNLGALSASNIVSSFKLMCKIRYFEEEIASAYSLGLIGGFCHLCIGQEAVYAGLGLHFQANDFSITSYRDHGLMVAVGSDLVAIAAELLGRSGGCSKGKGGSMHMFDPNKGFFGGHGIVGAQTSIGTGLAFSQKYKDSDGVTFVFFGDGAVNQGQFYESLNMAKLWSLPVVYVIENNSYAMGTAVSRSSCTEDLFVRASGFGVEGRIVDGMSLMSVFNDSKHLIDKCRGGGGPVVLEMKTYRYKGHSMSDPAKYRTREEVSFYRNTKDPIDNLRTYIVSNDMATEQELKLISKEIKSEIVDAIEMAKLSPLPDDSELFTNIMFKDAV